MSDAVMPERLCQCGCGTPVKRTFVRGHHMRMAGSHPPPKPLADRIRESSRSDPSTGCWLWQRRIDGNGFGQIKTDGTSRPAARVAYKAFVGDAPDALVVYQTCENRACVRPEHLELITRRESVARGESDPAKHFAAYYERRRNATHCPRGHLWDEENTRLFTYQGYQQRICRACMREDAERRRSETDFADAERARNRELYAENRDEILARKSEKSRARYAAARDAGRCIRASCSNMAEPGRSQCAIHLKENAARTWGIKQYPMVDIYTERGLTTCWLCGGDFFADDPMWHDHLNPRSLGGPDEMWNFAPSHRSCNIRRRNTPLLETVALWHPDGLPAHLADLVDEAVWRFADGDTESGEGAA